MVYLEALTMLTMLNPVHTGQYLTHHRNSVTELFKHLKTFRNDFVALTSPNYWSALNELLGITRNCLTANCVQISLCPIYHRWRFQLNSLLNRVN